MSKYIVTGGCGFIGSHLIEKLLADGHKVINLDAFTYAGVNPICHENLKNIKVDIVCLDKLTELDLRGCDGIFHLAAESHVDNSLLSPNIFIKTNVIGTMNMLYLAKKYRYKFLHVSTDEVYGPKEVGESLETDSFNPSSPYSASKAAAEHIVNAYKVSFGVEAIIVRPCNNYGERQYPEKFIPKVIKQSLADDHVPIYGNGQNIREWIYVKDCVEGIIRAFQYGKSGDIFNIGSGIRFTNIEIAQTIINYINKGQLMFVEDRKGHDFRYAINSNKIKKLGWIPQTDFKTKIKNLCEEE